MNPRPKLDPWQSEITANMTRFPCHDSMKRSTASTDITKAVAGGFQLCDHICHVSHASYTLSTPQGSAPLPHMCREALTLFSTSKAGNDKTRTHLTENDIVWPWRDAEACLVRTGRLNAWLSFRTGPRIDCSRMISGQLYMQSEPGQLQCTSSGNHILGLMGSPCYRSKVRIPATLPTCSRRIDRLFCDTRFWDKPNPS